MGQIVCPIKSSRQGRPVRIFMHGLGGAGKSAVVRRLSHDEFTYTIPTIGIQIETFKYKNVNIEAWDPCGEGKVHHLYNNYYHNIDIIVFVLDSTDHGGIRRMVSLIHDALSDEEFRGNSALVLANKQDLDKAIGIEEIKQIIGWDKLQNFCSRPMC